MVCMYIYIYMHTQDIVGLHVSGIVLLSWTELFLGHVLAHRIMVQYFIGVVCV